MNESEIKLKQGTNNGGTTISINQNNDEIYLKSQKDKQNPQLSPQTLNKSIKLDPQKKLTQIAQSRIEKNSQFKLNDQKGDIQPVIAQQVNPKRFYKFRSIKDGKVKSNNNTLPVQQVQSVVEANLLQQQQQRRAQNLKKIYLNRQYHQKKSKLSQRKKTPTQKNVMNKTFIRKTNQSINQKQIINKQVQTQKRTNKSLRLQQLNNKKSNIINNRYNSNHYRQNNSNHIKQQIKNKQSKNSSKLLSQVKFNSFHHNHNHNDNLSINQFGSKDSNNNFKKSKSKNLQKSQKMFKNLGSILLQNDLDQPKLPQKSNIIKHNNFNTKFYLSNSFNAQQSTAPSLYTANYLQEISKLSMNFNSQVNTLRQFNNKSNNNNNNNNNINNQNSQFFNTIENQQYNNNNRSTKNSRNNRYLDPIIKNSTISYQKDNYNQVQGFDHHYKNNDQKQDSTLEQKKSMSIIAQKSQTANYSIQFQGPLLNQKSGNIFEQQFRGQQQLRHNNFLNQQQQDFNNNININIKNHINKNNILNNQNKTNPKKVDQMIQFPQISQIKIFSHQNKYQSINEENNRPIHQIRHHFNQEKTNYLFNDYRPKSKLLQNLQNKYKQFHIKKYKNGVYFGQLNQKSQKSGKGIIFYFNGKLYEGQFFQDLKNGQGYQEFPDHSKYIGKFYKGYKHGQGVFQWSNGEVYEGQWYQGKKHGSGMWKSPEGESYIGEWNNGKVQGFGVYITKSGDRYEGQFKNSQKNGYGTERYSNGQTYVGQFSKNRPNGQGQYFWSNGDYYKGAFLNSLKHGQGYFKSNKTGLTYEGNFLNDKKCGYGQLIIGDMIYTGNFQNDFKHGYGQLYENGQCKLKGYWVNDRPLDDDNESIVEPIPQGVPYRRNPSIISQRPQFIEQSKQRHKQNVSKQRKKVTKNRSPKHLASQANLEIKRLSKSKSPQNRSIESINNSLQKSNHRRACGCSRRH